jgi:hypothetical protein
MLRRLRRLGYGICALLVLTPQTRAQVVYPDGYGAYGWGGWSGSGGGTADGDVARGLGYFMSGAGEYNRQTAVANAINANTVLGWNQYWYNAQIEANRNERARLAARANRVNAAQGAAQERQHEHPTHDDIVSGDALNAALDEISDPRIHSSSLRLATASIPGRVVREIPFVHASEAATICLRQLTADQGWPRALRDPKFAELRTAYTDAVRQALDEDAEGDISAKTIKQVRDALNGLRARLEAAPPTDRAQLGEAEAHIKTLYGMTGMLEKPYYQKVLSELDVAKDTSLGSLLGFMTTFNLRFGRAVNPSQRAAYEALYPALDAFRNRVVVRNQPDEKTKPKEASEPSPSPGDFFRGMQLDHLGGDGHSTAPAPGRSK